MTQHFLQKYKMCEINSQAGVRQRDTLFFLRQVFTERQIKTIAARFPARLHPKFQKESITENN